MVFKQSTLFKQRYYNQILLFDSIICDTIFLRNNLVNGKMRTNYIVSAECAIKHKGKYLIIKRPMNKNAAGCLAFPGGGCELQDGKNDDDVLVQTAKREVLEEVGLKLDDDLNYVCSNMFYDQVNEKNVVHTLFFYSLNIEIVKLSISSDEVPEYYWLSVRDIFAMDNCPKWIRKYINIIEKRFCYITTK